MSKNRRVKRHASRMLVALAAFALVLTACGGDEATAPDEPAPEPDAPPAEAPDAEEGDETDGYPSQPITFIIPFPAGGGVDAQMQRQLDVLSRELGVPVEVDYVPGAGSQVGAVAVVRSAPDGYTIGMLSSPHLQSIYVNPDRQAGFEKDDFIPIALHTFDPHFVAVRADSPWQTLEELMDHISDNPGEVVTASQGILSPQHLTAVRIGVLTGSSLRVVQYDGGGEATAALLGGHSDVNFDGAGNIVPQVEAGEVRALAVLSDSRSHRLPDVPTAEEQGYPIYGEASRGYVAPAGTPDEVIQYIADAVRRMTEDPEHQESMSELGVQIRFLGPAEYRAYMDDYEEAVEAALALLE
jgi:tripartite-type tricarboxylate transporter receptor subunit TctC